MRLVYTFTNEKHAHAFATLLAKNKIESQLDISQEKDWGSEHYGDVNGKVWILDEDHLEEAKKLLNQFLKDPDDAQFSMPTPPKPRLNQTKKTRNAPPVKRPPITWGILILCTVIFITSLFTTVRPERLPSNLPLIPLTSPPIAKALYIDYPKAYMLLDQIARSWGAEKLTHPNTLPEPASILFKQFTETPFWKGIYPHVIQALQGKPHAWVFQAPLFEKVREGEVWRLVTPALLHLDLLHLFFNMMWLVMIGSQIEQRIGGKKYLLMMIVSAIVSNIAQYLMGGAAFVGFSGVLCAMIAFVWFRQKKAPWEGYQLHPTTMKFLVTFLLVMLGIQLWAFYSEISGHVFRTFIANTAHFTGALVGYVFAKIPSYQWLRKE